MVRHIVFWTLKDEAEGAGKEENAAKVKELLEALRGQIPGMLKIEVGRDFSASPVSADIALYSEFESREALDAYQVHPGHVAAKAFIGSVTASRQLADYEL